MNCVNDVQHCHSTFQHRTLHIAIIIVKIPLPLVELFPYLESVPLLFPFAPLPVCDVHSFQCQCLHIFKLVLLVFSSLTFSLELSLLDSVIVITISPSKHLLYRFALFQYLYWLISYEREDSFTLVNVLSTTTTTKLCFLKKKSAIIERLSIIINKHPHICHQRCFKQYSQAILITTTIIIIPQTQCDYCLNCWLHHRWDSSRTSPVIIYSSRASTTTARRSLTCPAMLAALPYSVITSRRSKGSSWTLSRFPSHRRLLPNPIMIIKTSTIMVSLELIYSYNLSTCCFNVSLLNWAVSVSEIMCEKLSFETCFHFARDCFQRCYRRAEAETVSTTVSTYVLHHWLSHLHLPTLVTN